MTPNAPPNKHLDYLLTAYLFENLSAAGKKEVETHLAQCPACRDELDALRATMGLLATALNDGGKTYVFEEQRKKRVLDAARNGQLGFVSRKVGGWSWKLSAVAAIVMVGVVILYAASTPHFSRAREAASRYRGETTAAPKSEEFSVGLMSDRDDAAKAGEQKGVPNVTANRVLPKGFDGQIVLGSKPAQFGPQGSSRGENKSAPAAAVDLDPASSEDITLKIPADLQKKAELSDHFETDRPDSRLFREAPAGGGGTGGKTLEDMIGATATKTPGAKAPGTGGGPGDGVGNVADPGAGRRSFGNRSGADRRLMVPRHGGAKAKEEPAKESEGLVDELAAKPNPDKKPASPAAQEGKDALSGIPNDTESDSKRAKNESRRGDVALAVKDDTILPLQNAEKSKSPGQGQSIEELNKELNKELAQQNVTDLRYKAEENVSKQDAKKVIPEKAQDERTATLTGKNSNAPALGVKLPPPGETSAVDQDQLFVDVAKREPMKKPALNALPEPPPPLAYIIPPVAETPPPPPAGAIVTGNINYYIKSDKEKNDPKAPEKQGGANVSGMREAAGPLKPSKPSVGVVDQAISLQVQDGQAKQKELDVAGQIGGDGKGSATVDPLGQPARFGLFANGGGPGLTPALPAIEMWTKTKPHANDNEEHEFFSGTSNGKDDGARQNKLAKQGFVSKTPKEGQEWTNKELWAGIEKPHDENAAVSIHGGMAYVTEPKKSADNEKKLRDVLPKMQMAVKIDEGKINAYSLGLTSRAGDPLTFDVSKANNDRDLGDNERKENGFIKSFTGDLDKDTSQANGREQAKTPMSGLDPNVLFGDFGDLKRQRDPNIQSRIPASTDTTPGNIPFPEFVNGPNVLSSNHELEQKAGQYKLAEQQGDEVSISSAPVIQYPPNWDMISKRSDITAKNAAPILPLHPRINPNIPADTKPLDAAELNLRGYRALRDENPKLTLAQFFRRPDVVHPVPLTDEGMDEDDYVTKYGTRPFVDCARDHLSTFGLDVDTAAYTLARAALRSEKLPDPASVKVEEFLNYFKQAYQVQGDEAFGVFAESAQSPFVDSPVQARDATPLSSALNASNLHSRELLKIGIKSRAARPGERKPAMLTFVVDTSGSMSKPAGVYKDMSRLALVKQALATLVESLQPEDAVSIVGFRDQSELVLPRTQASQKQRILDAIDSMSARGSTNVETGLNLGYRMADEAYATNAVNRMILFSDGVANVGEKGPDEILKLVKIFASRGIDLSTIGVGMGKINDPMMRTLADNGNGSCHFADTLAEATNILTQKLPPHLNVLARDAKVQVDFDSDTVKSYRLLGYEKRKIADKDFRNDKIDSGDVTHDTLVTVFYEIVRQSGVHGALGKVYLRWKDAGSPRLEVVERNYPLEQGIYAGPAAKASPDFRFLACVARFAELLRDSKWTRQGSYAEVLAELDRLPNEFKAKPECQEVRDLIARAQRLSVTKWKSEILK